MRLVDTAEGVIRRVTPRSGFASFDASPLIFADVFLCQLLPTPSRRFTRGGVLRRSRLAPPSQRQARSDVCWQQNHGVQSPNIVDQQRIMNPVDGCGADAVDDELARLRDQNMVSGALQACEPKSALTRRGRLHSKAGHPHSAYGMSAADRKRITIITTTTTTTTTTTICRHQIVLTLRSAAH